MHVDHTATVTGSVWKLTFCQYCRADYAYEVKRTTTGFATSDVLLTSYQEAKDQALAEAQMQLQKDLAHDIEAVPCPYCGMYQSYMLPIARSLHRAWIGLLGYALLLVSFALLVFHFLGMRGCLEAAGASCVIGIGLVVLKVILSRRYEPNNEDEVGARLAYAKTRTISKEEYEKLLAGSTNKASS